jgi:hypothetical protein
MVGLIALLPALSGCPLSFEKEEVENAAPTTYFLQNPGPITFSNEVFFSWDGSDTDSDIVAYQFQMVMTDSIYFETGGAAGTVIESIDPRNLTGGEQWSDRTTRASRTFPQLDDGFYELRVRAIDSEGLVDDNPAEHRFEVFFDDILPQAVIISPTQGRLNGVQSVLFTFDASDESRNSITPRDELQYSYQLRALSLTDCTQHLSDPFTPWTFFPSDGLPITVGNAAPTIYTDMFPNDCEWEFTIRARDLAGNIGSATLIVIQNGS